MLLAEWHPKNTEVIWLEFTKADIIFKFQCFLSGTNSISKLDFVTQILNCRYDPPESGKPAARQKGPGRDDEQKQGAPEGLK